MIINRDEKKALMLASVASMIDLFNADNIKILLELGYSVDVATNFCEGSITSQERVDSYQMELNQKGIATYHIPIPRSISKIRAMVSSYFKIKRLVEKTEYQIVHCHSPIGAALCRLACRKARKKGTKVVYTAHGFHFFKGASKMAWFLFYPIEWFCSRYTDILITINKEDYDRAKKFGCCKVEYVPGIGVCLDEFNHDTDCNLKRKEVGIGENDFVFMSTGQLSVRKNHQVAIKAIAKIPYPNVKYLIVGFGEEEKTLRKLVEELKIEDRVIFAGYRSDVKQLLSVVDAYVFPSLQEGLPVSLMEAMAAGLPIVCSRIRGNIDLIQDGEGGYLVDCYDIDGIAKHMTDIIENDCSWMGNINYEIIKKYDVKNISKMMRDIYLMCG